MSAKWKTRLVGVTLYTAVLVACFHYWGWTGLGLVVLGMASGPAVYIISFAVAVLTDTAVKARGQS